MQYKQQLFQGNGRVPHGLHMQSGSELSADSVLSMRVL
jgi:hypothetical protein